MGVGYCQSLNDGTNDLGRVATEAACNSLSEEDLLASCAALGAEQTVFTLCLDLGFDTGNCEDAVAMFTGDAEVQGALALYGCAAMPLLQAPFCAQASFLTDEAESCMDWAGSGYLAGSVNMGAFNAAVANLGDFEFTLLSTACSSVTVSDACSDHPLGHICATIAQADGRRSSGRVDCDVPDPSGSGLTLAAFCPDS